MTTIVRSPIIVEHAARDAVDWRALLNAQEPVILRGIARHWPIVAAGRQSPSKAMEHIAGYDSGQPIVCYSAPSEIGGKFFYDPAMTGMNFTAARTRLADVFADITAGLSHDDPPSRYVGSTDVDNYLPGFRGANDLLLDDPMFLANPPTVSIWIGNRTTAAAHYDYSNNIACCLVGRRRFTLFPPDQIANLYPGPLEPTPGGQVVSLVDMSAPDFDRFPNFREALDAAQVAELEPGDALFYPAMWWHQVEALDSFNAMMNYWWNTSPAFLDTPMTTLLHGLMSLRDRPEPEKAAWRSVFDYYVFGPSERPRAHIPEAARGALAPFDDRTTRRMRAQLLDRLNR